LGWARSSAFALLSLELACIEARASAEGAPLEDIPPPTLPSLTHRDFTFDWTYAGAWISENGSFAPKNPSDTGVAWFGHAALEYPIVPRRWFFGAAEDFASAHVPGAGTRVLYGNPEITVRGVWSNRGALAAGGGVGVVVPMPRDLDAAGRAVLNTLEIVRAWDSAYFSDSFLTFRPTLDFGLRFKPLLVQLRQGLDVSYSLIDDHVDIIGRSDLFAELTFDPVAIGVEALETYSLKDELLDEQRAAVTISPSVRVRLPRVSPGLSVQLPFLTPLGGEARSFVVVRLHLTFVLDRKAEEVDATH